MANPPPSCHWEEAKAMVGQEGACLKAKECEVTVLVHPRFTRDQLTGVRQELDALTRRSSKELGGVVLAYEKLRLASSRGWLFDTNPFIHLRVSAHFIVFCPAIGNTLKAVVQKKTRHHLGCLAHGSFNISVPRPAKDSVEEWPGTLAAEGDTLTLNVLFTSLTSYLMPFIRAAIHPDCAKELLEKAEAAVEGATISTSEENEASLSSTRIIFDDDSGISSNELDENVKVQEGKGSNDELKEKRELRKKKKKKKKGDVGYGISSIKFKSKEESAKERGKKRKRSEEENEEDYKKRKKKNKGNESYSEAEKMESGWKDVSILTKSSTLSKKKGTSKNNYSKNEKAVTNASKVAKEMQETQINSLSKIKVEKMDSDEATGDKEKKKKKKQKQQQEQKEGQKEDEDQFRKTLSNMKKEKLDDNNEGRNKKRNKLQANEAEAEERVTNYIVSSPSKKRKQKMEIKQERIEETSRKEKKKGQPYEDDVAEGVMNDATLPRTKKKNKIKIKQERLSQEEGRSLNNLPIPLFMIKRERMSPKKAKIKKEKG